MDPVQIFIVVVFLVFSAVQLFLQGRGSPPPLPPDEEETGAPGRVPAPREAPRPADPVEWPDVFMEEVDQEDPAEEPVLAGRLPVEEIPEAVRVAVPVMSMETLTVDRSAEHDRLHQRIAAGSRPPRPAAALPSPAEGLRSRSELRRAVLLAEVLGPPRSLR